MVLLCTSLHKSVHEGGFQINRNQSGELFFHQSGGKAVPHCGYYRDDWVDKRGGENDTLAGNSVKEASPLYH